MVLYRFELHFYGVFYMKRELGMVYVLVWMSYVGNVLNLWNIRWYGEVSKLLSIVPIQC